MPRTRPCGREGCGEKSFRGRPCGAHKPAWWRARRGGAAAVLRKEADAAEEQTGRDCGSGGRWGVAKRAGAGAGAGASDQAAAAEGSVFERKREETKTATAAAADPIGASKLQSVPKVDVAAPTSQTFVPNELEKWDSTDLKVARAV